MQPVGMGGVYNQMSLQKISKIGDAAVNGALDLIKQIITERLDSVE